MKTRKYGSLFISLLEIQLSFWMFLNVFLLLAFSVSSGPGPRKSWPEVNRIREMHVQKVVPDITFTRAFRKLVHIFTRPRLGPCQFLVRC